MASSIVSNLIAASALDGAEIYYGVQGSADRKVTGAQIKTHVSDSPTLITPTVVTSVTGAAGSDILFAGGAAANDTASAPAVNVTAAEGGATSGAGGAINIISGSSTEGDGGAILMTAADGNGTPGNGGGISLVAGTAIAHGQGGSVQIISGDGAANANGGGFDFTAGNGGEFGDGGSFAATAGSGGSSNGNGGNTSFLAGNALGDGNGGAAIFTAGNGGATSGNGGNITLTPGTVTSGTVGHILLSAIANFADDAAAATGGVPVTGVYRSASVLKIRVA